MTKQSQTSNALKTVVIDARMAGETEGHGIARYVQELVKNLITLPSPQMKFVLLVNADSPFLKVALPENFSIRMMRFKWISLLGMIELAVLLRRLKPNLVHSPSYLVPLFSKTPLVCTIHDLNHVVLAENYSLAHKVYYNLILPYYLKLIRRVITVSHFSKSEILKFLNIDPARVEVIYNGISPNFVERSQQSPEQIEKFKRRYELPDEFILSSGNRKPHKNMAKLVEAYCKGDFNMPLVLRTEFDPQLLAIAEKYNKRHAIHFLRFVTYEEFPYLYCLAKVFVFPSVYEGFGLPPLEAAACGVPVIVSNRSSLPEVMKTAARFVDPNDSTEMMNAIKSLLTDQTERAAMSERGLSVVKQYAWRRMAQQTLSLYREILFASNTAPLVTPHEAVQL